MYIFLKQKYIEVERGFGYMNYQRELAILIDSWQKTTERSKSEEINRKKPKINLKIKNVPILRFKGIFSGLKI